MRAVSQNWLTMSTNECQSRVKSQNGTFVSLDRILAAYSSLAAKHARIVSSQLRCSIEWNREMLHEQLFVRCV